MRVESPAAEVRILACAPSATTCCCGTGCGGGTATIASAGGDGARLAWAGLGFGIGSAAACMAGFGSSLPNLIKRVKKLPDSGGCADATWVVVVPALP